MDINIYDKDAIDDTVFLKLEKTENGAVALLLVDRDGERKTNGEICTINSEGLKVSQWLWNYGFARESADCKKIKII